MESRKEVVTPTAAPRIFSIPKILTRGGKNWLGGLDSNQDKQIQNLLYCQLYDLPTG